MIVSMVTLKTRPAKIFWLLTIFGSSLFDVVMLFFLRETQDQRTQLPDEIKRSGDANQTFRRRSGKSSSQCFSTRVSVNYSVLGIACRDVIEHLDRCASRVVNGC